jgi:hypothetical protein
MRIVTSPRYSVSAWEIRDRWSLEDLLDAHLCEDMYIELERKAAKPAI